jgi:hypothetical protein
MEHSGANIEQLIKEAKHKLTSEKFGLNETAEQTEPVRSILELQKATGWTLFDIKERYIAKQIKIIRYDIRTNLKTGELFLFGGHVTESEYDRCTDFARSQQGKPTAEQLEAKISDLEAENEQLKKQLAQSQNPKIDETRIQTLTFWVEGKGKETVELMEKSDIQKELSKIDAIFKMATSSFSQFWKSQKVIELKAGKRAKQVQNQANEK